MKDFYLCIYFPICHKDHEISYAKYGSFFCDCGAKEDGSCLVNCLFVKIQVVWPPKSDFMCFFLRTSEDFFVLQDFYVTIQMHESTET
uniref:UBR-type domain-containing protein n=1 Tax=Nothoprocta perdicaria TaxID=30464 RepID=A0A8C6ZIF0_NOTPE